MKKRFYKVPTASAGHVLGLVLKQCDSAGSAFMIVRASVGDDHMNRQIVGFADSTADEMAAAIAPAPGAFQDNWKKKLRDMAGE